MRPEHVASFFDKSRVALGLDYIDLYLAHQPIGVQLDINNEKNLYMKQNSEGKVSCYSSKPTLLICQARLCGRQTLI